MRKTWLRCAAWLPPFVVAVTLAAISLAQSPAAKPKLPPGVDPGGAVIGLITTGIDYTRPEIERCLARDGEGELIGWDIVDRDRLPYKRQTTPAQPSDDALFNSLPCGKVRVVPVRVDPTNAVTLGKAMAFLAATTARVVVLPVESQPVDWAPLIAAAMQFPTLLLVIAVGDVPLSPGSGAPAASASIETLTVRVAAAVLNDGHLSLAGVREGMLIDLAVLMPRASVAEHAMRSQAAILSAMTLVCKLKAAGRSPQSGAEMRAALIALGKADAALLKYPLLAPSCS